VIRRALALGLALGLVLAAVPLIGASAHEEVPGVRAVIDRITPTLPGVRVQTVISVADELVVDNPTATDLLVLADTGEPFLRIGPSGVFGNVHSPTWFLSNDPTGTTVPPKDASPSAPPLFARVSTGHSWGWFDHRMHRVPLATAPLVPDPSKPVRLESWAIPLRYGAEAVTVSGHREYRAPQGAWAARVVKSPKGLRAIALPGPIPAITVRPQRSAGTVTVIGEAGERMAQITDTGLAVNEASPTWAFTEEAEGSLSPSGLVGPDQPARWQDKPNVELTWLDHRAQVVTPDGNGRPGQRKRWSIPVLVDGRRAAIEGETSWVAASSSPPAGRHGHGVPLAAWLAGGAAVAAVAGGVALGRRKWRRAG
jgi:hypothetical protein